VGEVVDFGERGKKRAEGGRGKRWRAAVAAGRDLLGVHGTGLCEGEPVLE